MFKRIFMLILCTLNLQQDQKCRLNSRTHFGQPLPVIVKDGRLLEPNDKYGTVELNYGDELTLSCEGAGPIIHPNTERSLTTATITCENGDMFTNNNWLNGPARFSYFRCQYPPNYMSKKTNRTCYESNSVFEVGYTIEGHFYPLFESCFNEGMLNPIYSKYTQKAYNAMYQTKVERPFFISNEIYGNIPVESLFSPKSQRAAVAQLVGSKIETYMSDTQHLSRGHLAAKTDFVFAFGERATFHYVNCAPQWTGFNGGNWNTLEVDLRNHIHDRGYDTIIYTGTYGVTQLDDQYGRRVDIYLTTDENNNPVIPVPQYYYKVVYEPSTQRGIAYVGLNNPYYSPAEAQALFFCKDMCRGNREFYWLTWHPNNPSEGYTFCCTVQDFTNTVHHLPHFEVTSVLI